MYFSIVQRIIFAHFFQFPAPVKSRTSLTTRIERSNLKIQPAGYIRRNTVFDCRLNARVPRTLVKVKTVLPRKLLVR